jgi:hypothetical protein
MEEIDPSGASWEKMEMARMRAVKRERIRLLLVSMVRLL